MTTRWNSQLYDQSHSFVWKYGADLVPYLDAKPGERIVDLGCGTGHLSAKIAEGGAHVFGLDSSPDMIHQARKAYPNLEFRVADGAAFTLDQPVDAVFSNAALHWMLRADDVVRHISAALKPGGRFVAEMGGQGNNQILLTAIRNAFERRGFAFHVPWFFPSIAQYSQILERHGLEPREMMLFDRLTPLEETDDALRKWLTMFGERLLGGVPEAQRESLLAEVESELEPKLKRDGRWFLDYRRLRFRAFKT